MGRTSSRLEMHHIAPIASPWKLQNIRGPTSNDFRVRQGFTAFH